MCVCERGESVRREERGEGECVRGKRVRGGESVGERVCTKGKNV